FESTIHKVVALVLFLPVIIGLAGNAGIQSVTVVNRGMALGEVDKEEEVGIFMRELKAGLLLGVACALIMGGIAWVWQGNSVDTPYLLGVIVGVSMFLTITMAVSMGTVAPLVLRRFGVDPAIASGPFVTTSIDIVGLVLYFSIATICLSYL
ncbi:MAG: magnesium transporter, partial [bacterium]|nr:magnesium transporter [bacterium]